MGLGPRATAIAASSSLAILLAALPASAANLTVTDITVGGAYEITVPSVEATDTNLTEAQIRGLFSGDFLTEAGALANLDAASVKIPEIRMTYDLPVADGAPQKALVIYKDIELTGVTDGVATSVVVGGGSVEGGAGIAMTFGKMSASTFDLGGLLSFYGVGEPNTGTDFKTLYADFAFDGASFKGPNFSCKIGPASLDEFKARPLQTNFAEITKLLGSIDETKAPEPQVVGQIIDFYADFLTAFQSTPMQMDGFSCAITGPKGEAIDLTAGGTEMGGFNPGMYPSLSLSDLHIEQADMGWVSLGNFTFKQTDLSGAIAALQYNKDLLSEAWFEKNWRKIIPAFDGMSFSDFAVDAPNPEDEHSRVAGSIGDFDISLADWFNGIPGNISLGAHDVVFTLPDAAARAVLATIGIKEVDLGYDLDMHWDRDAKTIVLENFTLTGAQMGTVALSGTLGNAGPDLFSEDMKVAEAAAMNLSIKDLTIDLDDAGLSYLLIGMMASQQDQDPLVLRAGLSAMVSGMTMGILGASPSSLKAASQIAAFLNGTPKLNLKLTANDDAGISLPEIMAAEKDPRVLAGRFTLEATASGDPIAAPTPLAVETPDTPADEPTDAPADDLSPAQRDKLGNKN